MVIIAGGSQRERDKGKAVDRLRVAVVHSFYSSNQPSGENSVVVDQAALLSEAGHDVVIVERRTDDRSRQLGYSVRTAWGVATGRGSDPTQELTRLRPDVVHIHNLFPNLGTNWVADWRGPVAVSLHNYRFACANGLLFRSGATCHECPDLGMSHAVVHGCYRDSRVASVPLALSRRADQRRVLSRADAVITTSRSSDALIRSVIPVPMRTHVVPNFGAGEAQTPRPVEARSGWIALGRMSEEKGLLELAAEWPGGHTLTIIGDGPQQSKIRETAAARGIDVRSSVSRDELRSLLPGFLGLVFPSRWAEVAPQVVVEAMRVGLPVVALDQNGVAELVADSGAGCVYSDSSSLGRALDDVAADCNRQSQRAVDYYSSTWRPDLWLESIERIYGQIAGRTAS